MRTQVNFRFNTEAFWNAVKRYEEEMPRMRVEAAKLLLTIVQEDARPK